MSYVFLLAFILFPLSLFADLKILQDSREEFTIRLKTEEPTKQVVYRDGARYLELSVPSLSSFEEAGVPGVPFREFLLHIPEGTELEYSVKERSPFKAESLLYDIAFPEREPIHSALPRFAKRNVAAYQNIYGRELVQVVELDFAGRDKLARIRLWPFWYDARKRQLVFTEDFTVRFSFSKSQARGSSEAVVPHSNLHLAVLLSENQGALERAWFEGAKGKDLIIAHTAYQNDLFQLLEYKNGIGRPVKTVFVEGKSAKDIKALIAAEYQSAEPPTQTLLIGNNSQIPSFSGSGDNTWTDYPYQKLGNGSLPDTSLGRLPVSTVDELRIVIEKIIGREIELRNMNDILLTAGSDTGLGCPANVTKVGDKIKAASSSINIIKKYKTNVSTSEVIAGYNGNPNFIVYDGHGNRQGMTEIPLMISDLNQLTNKSFPILLDIACLNANWSSSAGWKNFTSSILTLAEHGVAGIMASGGSGMGHTFFQSIGELMAKAHPANPVDPRMGEIGNVILAAKIKHNEQDRSYWNYYGDPASSVWATSPNEQ